MALSFAGVSLPLTTPEHQEWLSRIHPQDFRPWDAWNYKGSNLDALPTPSYPAAPPVRFGVLHWPTGATRPAWFHCIVNTERLNEIREAVGEGNTLQPLVMSDGRSGKTITAQMYMLPPRPLNQLGVDASDAWVLTLTDKRFYWSQWNRYTGSGISSWGALFAGLASAIGTDISVLELPTAYQTPSPKWNLTLAPAGVVLDCAATQIGQRVVASLSGYVNVVTWETAKGNSDLYLASSGTVISGGYFNPIDISRYLPTSCAVAFYNATSQATPYLSIRNIVTDGPSDFAEAVGFTSATGWVYADYAYTGANLPEITGYASQAAYDWYGWFLQDTDLVFPGIEPWVPTGWEDYIEWSYELQGVGQGDPIATTLIRRGAWDSFANGVWTGPSLSSQNPQNSTPVTVRLQTKACLVSDGSGPPSGITNEYIDVTLPVGSAVSQPYCEVDPTCCEPPLCCPGEQLPDYLYAVIQSPCGPSIGGPLRLIGDTSTQSWVGTGTCSSTGGIELNTSCLGCDPMPQLGNNLKITFSDPTGDLNCLDGVEVILYYQGLFNAGNVWGVFCTSIPECSVNGQSIYVIFSRDLAIGCCAVIAINNIQLLSLSQEHGALIPPCGGSGDSVTAYRIPTYGSSGSCFGGSIPGGFISYSTVTCSPFELVFEDVPLEMGNDYGTVTVTLTEN